MKILNSSSRFMRRLILAACSVIAILVVVNAHLLVGQLQLARTAFSPAPMKVDDVDITCTISAQKTEYAVGEAPEISVFLHNNEGRNVTLVGSLDGSDDSRSPRCHFEIAAPHGHESAVIGRCGNINSIRMADFVDVPAGGKFDPFRRENGFFGSSKLRWENFVTPGRYRFTFRYSTVGWSKIKDGGLVLGKPPAAARERLKDVPRFEATSNTIELTFGPPPNGFVYGTKVPMSRAANRGSYFISGLFSKPEFNVSELDIVWLLARPIGKDWPHSLFGGLLEFEREIQWKMYTFKLDEEHRWRQHVITPNTVWTSEATTHAVWKVSTLGESNRKMLDEISIKELGRREMLSGLRQTIKSFNVNATDKPRRVAIFVVTDEPLLPVDVSTQVSNGSVSPMVFRMAIKDGSWIPYPVAVPATD
jgi:hypothetical protein